MLVEGMEGTAAVHPAKVIGANLLAASTAGHNGELLLSCSIVLLLSKRDVTPVGTGNQFSAQGAEALGRHGGIDAVQAIGAVAARGEFNKFSFVHAPDTSPV